MVSSRHLHWEDEDTEALKQYKADLESGKVKPVTINRANINSVLARNE